MRGAYNQDPESSTKFQTEFLQLGHAIILLSQARSVFGQTQVVTDQSLHS